MEEQDKKTIYEKLGELTLSQVLGIILDTGYDDLSEVEKECLQNTYDRLIMQALNKENK